MPGTGYGVTFVLIALSVVLIGWNGFQEASSGWVFGALATLWSLAMMLRLITLSRTNASHRTPEPSFALKPVPLAQKLLQHFHAQQDAEREILLQRTCGGSFWLFSAALLLYLVWLAVCAMQPARADFIQTLQTAMAWLDVDWRGSAHPLVLGAQLYDWARGVMVGLSVLMMAFVCRSYADHARFTRSLMIVIASYAVAGFMTFAGIAARAQDAAFRPVIAPDWMGNGFGTGVWLQAAQTGNFAPSVFDVVLTEGGLVGLSLLVFAFFVPVCVFLLSLQSKRPPGGLIAFCMIVLVSCLVGSLFLPMMPALGAYMVMCLVGVFMGWGFVEVRKPIESSSFVGVRLTDVRF